MQGSFKLDIKGNLTNIKKFLKAKGILGGFYSHCPTKTNLIIEDECNLSSITFKLIKEILSADPKVEITFDLIYDTGFVTRYYKKKNSLNFTENDDLCACNGCGKIIPVEDAIWNDDDEIYDFPEYYCKECYEEYEEDEE